MKVSEKRCVLSIKRQHHVDEQIPDVVLSSSWEQNLTVFINGSKLNSTTPMAVSEENSTGFEGERESVSEPPSAAPGPSDNQLGDVQLPSEGMPTECNEPTPEIPGSVAEESPNSPIPGPSHYEEISFEPLVTSTPRHGDEEHQEAEDVQEGDKSEKWDWVNPQEVKEEFEEGRVEVKRIKNDFLHDVKSAISLKAKVYLPQLAERRNKLSIQLRQLAKHKVMVDNLFRALSGGLRQIDKEIENFDYFVEHFPEIVNTQQ